MDLNQLYFDRQVALIRAQGAATSDQRRDHEVVAAGIAGRIRHEQGKLGAAAACAWMASAGPQAV